MSIFNDFVLEHIGYEEFRPIEKSSSVELQSIFIKFSMIPVLSTKEQNILFFTYLSYLKLLRCCELINTQCAFLSIEKDKKNINFDPVEDFLEIIENRFIDFQSVKDDIIVEIKELKKFIKQLKNIRKNEFEKFIKTEAFKIDKTSYILINRKDLNAIIYQLKIISVKIGLTKEKIYKKIKKNLKIEDSYVKSINDEIKLYEKLESKLLQTIDNLL